ncbi:MAG: LD-carboxypeptidase [Bradymonadaceae bacterium]|nr:LD-carboxypeptidase [Lujinxingiaceae bacterium]
MNHPRALKRGDRVAIVSPSGPITPALLEQGLFRLRSWGLKPVVADAVYARRPRADYLAGDDASRVEALHEAFLDPTVAAIICSRGGYGAMRILPYINPEIVVSNPKLVVGFSDITALHTYFAGLLDLVTLHGPVVKSLALHEQDGHASLEHLERALFGQRACPLEIDGLRSVKPGRGRGRLLGGNLSVLTSMLATDYCPDLKGAVLLLEEICEVDYRLDRLFTTLRLATKAHGLAALILGDFTECSGTYVNDADLEAFVDALGAEFDCPVVANFPSGHGPRNLAVPMGVEVEVDADRGRVSFARDATHAPV